VFTARTASSVPGATPVSVARGAVTVIVRGGDAPGGSIRTT
jgi:hypothetical protein